MPRRDRPGQHWRLRIIEQPEAEFFKDEGGKHHALEVLVRLEPIGPTKLSPEYKRGDLVVPLRVELYYESEQRVEDVDQASACDTPETSRPVWMV